ncbi:extracellular solute-binding protein [Microlunatus sp. Y2014]|uniref:extracellular solute-binding protein n=1 Tax=Microlunatus sp. Y2014 TaxID=3418488 RepID=UPI003DA7A18D
MTDPILPGLSRRRVLGAAAGLGAAAATTWLAGCDSGGTTPQSNETPAGVANVPKKELGPEAADGPFYPDSFLGARARDYEPFTDGAKTFKVVVPQDPVTAGDWNTNHFSQWLEERTGMKVEYQAVLTTDAEGATDMTKINAMIASGDVPDAFIAIPFTPAQISLYGEQGLFVPLDDLIETYAPELRQAFTDYPDLRRDLKSLDGKTYQMKCLSDCFHCKVSGGRAWVHEDYLADVGGAMPTTTEELRELLMLFKERDPSGTGQMIPLAAGEDNPLENYFMNSFLQTPATDWITLNDGKVVFVADKPEWREGLRYLRTLYDDGTLTTSTLTATAEEVLTAGNQGRIGVARSYYQGQIADLSDKPGDLWTKYVALPPVKGPGGVQLSCWSDNLTTGIPLLITNKATNPELFVQWGDYQLELTAQLMSYGGDKGPDGNWDWAAEGDTGLNGEQAVWYNKEFPAPVGQGWGQKHLYYFSKGFREGQRSDPERPNFEQFLYEATKPYEQYKPARENQLPKLIFDDASAADQSTRQASIEPFVKQSFAEFCTGKQDINDDAAWQSYVDTLDQMGVKQQVELYQRTFEAMPK